METKQEKKYSLVRNREREEIVFESRDILIQKMKEGVYSSLSGCYNTEEELRADLQVPNEPCRQCGTVFSTHFIDPVGQELRDQNICFICHHWNFQLTRPGMIIVNGVKYQDSGSVPKGTQGFLGHGGREFVIQMKDGRIFTTNNMWCQGELPQRLRDKYPDNAKFL